MEHIDSLGINVAGNLSLIDAVSDRTVSYGIRSVRNLIGTLQRMPYTNRVLVWDIPFRSAQANSKPRRICLMQGTVVAQAELSVMGLAMLYDAFSV